MSEEVYDGNFVRNFCSIFRHLRMISNKDAGGMHACMESYISI